MSLRRTIPTLRGLAILGVVLNHANWHVLSKFTPGEVPGYLFVASDQVCKFAIPAFMFIAGYFIAYATSGGKHDLRWAVIRARLENLLWPWLIWSVVLMIGQSFQGRPISLTEFLRTLFVHYYFIPLLSSYYLLAPLVVKWARSATRMLLIGALIVQLLTMALFYGRVYYPNFPAVLKSWVDLGPLQYLRFALYFPAGVVFGMFPRRVKDSLTRLIEVRSVLPWLTLLLFGLAVAEAAVAYNMGGEVWPQGGDQAKFSSALFSIALILCFTVYDRLSVPFNRTVNELGTRSYGLYLCHYPILGIMARVIKHIAPWVASQGWLFLPLLFGLTVALSMLLMEGVAKLPARRFYRYLFG